MSQRAKTAGSSSVDRRRSRPLAVNADSSDFNSTEYVSSSTFFATELPPLSRPTSPSRKSDSIVLAAFEAKLDRKRVEGDLQMLASRVSLLKTEEQKALQKVSETKERAKEILVAKKERENMLQLRLSHSMTRELAQKSAQERASMEREMRQKKLMLSKKLHYDAKKGVAVEQKSHLKKMEVQLEYQKLQMEQDRRIRAEDCRKAKRAAKLQRQKELEDKEIRLRLDFQNKLQEETRRREEAVQLLELLEKEERDLIERLQKTNELQRSAYSILSRSLDA